MLSEAFVAFMANLKQITSLQGLKLDNCTIDHAIEQSVPHFLELTNLRILSFKRTIIGHDC